MNRFRAGIKEWWRKQMVSLKRRPHNIALFCLVISFFVFTLNLTPISESTRSGAQPMGLCAFVTFLASILCIVCFINAFPKRKKTNIPMLIILIAFLIVMVICDILYLKGLSDLMAFSSNEKTILNGTNAQGIIIGHLVCLGFSIIALALLPVYSKLLKKINTSIEIEVNENMHEIDIEEA